jgi:hypothetical protein
MAKRAKIYQTAGKYTKYTKIYQITIKYTKIYQMAGKYPEHVKRCAQTFSAEKEIYKNGHLIGLLGRPGHGGGNFGSGLRN